MRDQLESLPTELYVVEGMWHRYYHSKSAVKGVITRLKQQHKRSWRKNEPFKQPKIWVADVKDWRETDVSSS